jgi:hypothetical protein
MYVWRVLLAAVALGVVQACVAEHTYRAPVLAITNETTFSALDWVPALGDPLDESRQTGLCVTPDALMPFVDRCPRPVCPGDRGYDVAAEGSCYYETCDFHRCAPAILSILSITARLASHCGAGQVETAPPKLHPIGFFSA